MHSTPSAFKPRTCTRSEEYHFTHVENKKSSKDILLLRLIFKKIPPGITFLRTLTIGHFWSKNVDNKWHSGSKKGFILVGPAYIVAIHVF